MIVIDAGGEYSGYSHGCDAPFPRQAPTARQREIYGIVLAAQKAAVAAVKPG